MRAVAPLLALLWAGAAIGAEPEIAPAQPGDGKLHVYFLDVGQGDAAIIVSPVGRTVLIDGGPPGAGAHLALRIHELVGGPLDLVVLTHPRADHLGGLAAAVRSMGARRFLDPALKSSDPAYEHLLEELKAGGTSVVVPVPDPKAPEAPVRIGLGGGAELAVLWPRSPVEPLLGAGERTIEANGLIMRLEFAQTAVLFAADATLETEQRLTRAPATIEATLLKVPAHAASTCCSAAFLAAVKPRAAVVSVGAGNQQGAPSRAALARLDQARARVFRTDLDGEIHAVSDGTHMSLTTERPAAGEAPRTPYLLAVSAVPIAVDPPRTGSEARRAGEGDDSGPFPAGVGYVALKTSRYFHSASCKAVRKIPRKNLALFNTRAEAAREHRPADDCRP